MQPHHKFLASKHVNHKLAKACTKALQKKEPKVAELIMRLRYGAFLGKPNSNICPLCKEEGAILQHEGDDSIHSCDYVDHVLHACTAEEAAAARTEAQETCDAWAPPGVEVTIASATEAFPLMAEIWPENELFMDLRGLPASSSWQLKHDGVDELNVTKLLNGLYAPLVKISNLLSLRQVQNTQANQQG